METAFWIVSGVVATVYATGLMMTQGWLLARMTSLGRLLRGSALVAAVGLLVWAAVIDLVL